MWAARTAERTNKRRDVTPIAITRAINLRADVESRAEARREPLVSGRALVGLVFDTMAIDEPIPP